MDLRFVKTSRFNMIRLINYFQSKRIIRVIVAGIENKASENVTCDQAFRGGKGEKRKA
jgi:hypothetical protein